MRTDLIKYSSPTYLLYSVAPGRDAPDFAHLVLSRAGETGRPQEATGYWTRQSKDQKLWKAQGGAQRRQAEPPAGPGREGPAAAPAPGAWGLRDRRPAGRRAGRRTRRGGGVREPWRGTRNTPCRKRHVTVTAQKPRAPPNKGRLCGRLALGLARRGRTPYPQPGPRPRLPPDLGRRPAGRLRIGSC